MGPLGQHACGSVPGRAPFHCVRHITRYALAVRGTQERVREELGYRTIMMSEEMEKWRQQAALTANAVLEAKNEVRAGGCGAPPGPQAVSSSVDIS